MTRVVNQIEFIIDPRKADIGIPVKRILPWVKKRMVGPFVFLDEMGPKVMKAPGDLMDVKAHPHIGLSTLTYLFEGTILHRDSLGSEQLIVPGEVNWMTAGKGISHSEKEPLAVRNKDRRVHGLQFWVALPKELEDIEPSFIHYEKKDIPEFDIDSLNIKLVAGSAFGKSSKLMAHSPMTFMVLTALDDGTFSFAGSEQENALYIVQGSIEVNGKTFNENQMLVFKTGSDIVIKHSKGAIFILIGGEGFPEARHIWWNFVSSSKDKIEEAKRAWRDRTFPQVLEDEDYIPLPEGSFVKTPDYP